MKKEPIKQSKISVVREIIQRLDDLITEGIYIKNLAEIGSSFQDVIRSLWVKEQSWYKSVEELWLREPCEICEISDIRVLHNLHRDIFLPLKLGYEDAESKKSQGISEKIGNNASKVSELLLEIKQKLLKIAPEGFLVCDGLKLDLDSGKVEYGKTEVMFRRKGKMYKLFVYFLRNRNEEITQEKALKDIYPADYRNLVGLPRYRYWLKNTVNNIRKKLEMSGKNKERDLFEFKGSGSYMLSCKD